MKKICMTVVVLSLTMAFLPASGVLAASKKGKEIAFASNRDGNFEIYVMRADGSHAERLTFDPGADRAPAWSPDGKEIAFQTNRDGNDEIYVMKANGTHLRNLTNNPASDGDPAWSPDGTRIAFSTNRDGNSEVYVMDVRGGGLTNLTDNDGRDESPTWSPESSRIAFWSDRNYPGWYGGIYAMDADGSDPHVLFGDDGEVCYLGGHTAWSPHGNAIAYSGARHRASGLGTYMFDTVGDPHFSFGGYFRECTQPAWAPDGRSIAFTSDYENLPVPIRMDIFVLDSGGNAVNLTNNPAWDVDPAWSP